jgi:hypothetical protein
MSIKTNSNVYIIKQGDYYKIGESDNINKRIKTIQTYSPIKLDLIAYLPCKDKKQAKYIEGKLHDKFILLNTSGEWFKLLEHNIHEIINSYKFILTKEYDYNKYDYKETDNHYPEIIKKSRELYNDYINSNKENKKESLYMINQFSENMFNKHSKSKYIKLLRECPEFNNIISIEMHMSL